MTGRVCRYAALAWLAAIPVWGQTPFSHQGFDALHPPDSAIPNEQVDPASGTLSVSATDLVLPGNAGFNLAITRVYNSSVYPNYDSGSTAYEEDSWAGIGWKLHFGRILHADSTTPGEIQVEMGDGSRHPLYHSLAVPGSWTTSDFWIYDSSTHKLKLPNGLVYTFDRQVFINSTLGNVRYVTEIRDPFQNVVTFSYFSSPGPIDGVQQIHQVLSATQSRDVTFTYDGTSKAIATMSYLTHTWTYSHDAIANPAGYSVLRTVQPPAGASTVYGYGANGNLTGEMTSIGAPLGGQINYTYADSIRKAGTYSVKTRVVTQRTTYGHGVAGGTWTFTYGTGANQDTTQVACPCGWTTSYKFDGTGLSADLTVGWKAGTLIDVTIVQAGATLEHRTMAWAASQPISSDTVTGPWTDSSVRKPLLTQQVITRNSSSWTTNYTFHTTDYNDYGQPYFVEETMGGYDWRRTQRTFKSNFTGAYILNRVVNETVDELHGYGNSDGHIYNTWTYDNATGFLTHQTVNAIGTSFEARTDGNVNAVTDGRGNRTTFTYSWGRVSAVHSPLVDVTYGISAEGLTTSETSGGLTTTYGYDPAFRANSIQAPNRNAITFATDDLHGTYFRVQRGNARTDHLIDGFGREVAVVNSLGVRSDTNGDACGRTTFTSLPYTGTPTNQGTSVQYDALGRVTRVTDPAGKMTVYSYNGVNVTRVDANNRTTQFNYLAFGDPSDARLISVVDAAGTTTTYQYAITGALRSVSGPAPGVQRTWVINDKGRPDSDTQPEAGTTTYVYDPSGNLTSTTNANGQMTTFTYDANNRLLTRDGPGTADDLSITYDNANHIDRVLSMTGGGVLTTNTYNTAGTLATQVVQTSIGPASSSYAYDADDNLISIVYPSGREVSYAYDGENRLTTINQKPYGASTSSVFAHDFTYGGDGHLASYVTGAVTQHVDTQTGRLQRIWTSGGSQNLDLTYGYDDVGNVTSIIDPRPAATQTFALDALDRLTSASGPWGTWSWTYDVAGNRLTDSSPAPTNYQYNAATQRLTSTTGAVPETFAYDAVGRLTQDAMATYGYSAAGKLVSATAAGVTASYAYDGAGERLSRTVNGSSTFTLRGATGQTLSEYIAPCGVGVWSRDLIYGAGRMIGAIKTTAQDPTVAVTAGSVTVGESAGTAAIGITVTTANGAALACGVTASFHTTYGSAAAGADYAQRSGIVTFGPGTASGTVQTVTIPIVNDALDEDDETFEVDLTNATGGHVGSPNRTVVTITDDDPTPTLAISDVSQAEGNSGTTNATFAVSLSAVSGRVVQVQYATANGTALAGADYTAVSGTLTIPPGASSGFIPVPIIGEFAFEPNETYTVTLSAPVNATIADGQGLGTIVNDDSVHPHMGRRRLAGRRAC